MSVPIYKVIKGPAVVTHDQVTYFSQDDVTVALSPTLFEIQSSAYGSLGQRIDDYQAAVSFTPLGIPSADMFALYNKIASKPLNAFMAETRRVTAVDAAINDDLAVAGTALKDGTPVRIYSIGGTVPDGVDEDTLYYTNERDTGYYTLHATQAAAIAGTGVIELTDTGSGKINIIEQQPLRIQSLVDGDYLEFANSVVSQLANFRLGAASQIFSSPLGFRMFPKFGVSRATAGSVFTEGNAAITASLDPDDIVTQAYTAAWGASAPWDDFEFEDGVEVSFNLALNDNKTDSTGTGMVSLQSLSVAASGKPIGPDDAALASAMLIQGAGATRGSSMGGTDLNLIGTDVYIRLYNAHIQSGGLVYGAVNQRLGDVSWQSGRTVSAGVADPLFYFGAAAPA